MENQTRPYENLRLKTKFDLVNAIFSHLAKRERERERERKRERELGLGGEKKRGVCEFFSM